MHVIHVARLFENPKIDYVGQFDWREVFSNQIAQHVLFWDSLYFGGKLPTITDSGHLNSNKKENITANILK